MTAGNDVVTTRLKRERVAFVAATRDKIRNSVRTILRSTTYSTNISVKNSFFVSALANHRSALMMMSHPPGFDQSRFQLTRMRNLKICDFRERFPYGKTHTGFTSTKLSKAL
jgi:hypothetical protein